MLFELLSILCSFSVRFKMHMSCNESRDVLMRYDLLSFVIMLQKAGTCMSCLVVNRQVRVCRVYT